MSAALVVTVSEPMLLTVPEAAAHLRLSRARVFELIASGDLPSLKLGGARRIRRDALLAYLDSLGRPTA